MVSNIRDFLKKNDLKNAGIYDSNANKYINQLSRLKKDLSAKMKTPKRRSFMIYHPAYSYFASDFGIKEVAVETGGKEPSAATLVALVKKAKSNDVKLIFVAPQFSKRSSEVIAKEIGGMVVSIDHLAENYLKNTGIVGNIIAESLNK